jgi:hypothetical protein
MKRSRAIVLFGTMTLLIIGYVTWCWRTFLMGVDAAALTMFPEDYRPTALAEIEKSGILEPEVFQWGRAKELLMKPYDSSPELAYARQGSSTVFYIERSHFNCLIFNCYSNWKVSRGNKAIPGFTI